MTEIPLKPVKRIIKGVGADRVSKDAAKSLREEIEDYAEERASDALDLAEHAGRMTVQASDVKKSR